MTTENLANSLEGIGYCLDELEQEYLKVGIDHCKGLEEACREAQENLKGSCTIGKVNGKAI